MDFNLFSILIFIASVFHGILGFGFNIALTIFLFYFITPVEIFSLGITYALIINLPMAFLYYKYVNLRLFNYLILGGLFGVSFGLYLFLSLSSSILKILILLTYSISVFLLLYKPFLKLLFNKKNNLYIGIVSGFIGGLMCLPGFILSLYLNQKNINKKQFKGTLGLFFILIDIVIIYIYYLENIISLEKIEGYLGYFPFVISGLLIGVLLTRFFSEHTFKIFVYLFLCLIIFTNFIILLF